MSDIERLRVMLVGAETVAAVKLIYDHACGLAKEAATARNFALLDELTAVRLNCSRKGGALLLAGAERAPGIDANAAEQWCKRARLDEGEFAAVVSKALTMQRRRAGELSPQRAAQGRGTEPQARTLLSPWRADESGNLTRYVVGVDLKHYRQMIAAGGDPKKVEAELLAEALGQAA